jgi:hypothetical protein
LLPDCLQQATADQAFTNAVAAGDLEGQVAALQYRALERNTGQVGLASIDCTGLQAVNPEIAAISQHQDPASDGAADINKAIVLELAIQIASIGGDPLQAINSGTFEPGELGDPTAAGNTCNVEDDAEGCIFSQNLLVPDASEDEIAAAVAAGAVDDVAQNVTEIVDNNAAANVTGDAQAQADAEAKAKADADKAKKEAEDEAKKAQEKADKLKQDQKVKDNKNKNKDKNNDKNKNKKDNNDDKFNKNDYNNEINRQKNFDIILVQQLAAQAIFDVQAHAWQLIAQKQAELELLLLQQQIDQLLFQQQFFQFSQTIVINFSFAVNQYIGILGSNQQVLNLGGLQNIDFLNQFVGQYLGGLQDIQKLLNFGQVGLSGNLAQVFQGFTGFQASY